MSGSESARSGSEYDVVADRRTVRDGNELTGLAKIGYKPIGLIFGMIGGLIAGKVFGVVWKRVSGEDETPSPLSDDYSTREVLLAAALQGAIFGLVKTAIDRYGMKGVRRFVDAPLAERDISTNGARRTPVEV